MAESGSKGFTLIELLVVVALLALMSLAVTLSIQGALESWSYTKDQLSLQKVMSETMNAIVNGSYTRYGLKDSLEILAASEEGVVFVPPWVDHSHTAEPEDTIYTLNRGIQPGAAVPIGQLRLPGDPAWRVVPVIRVELEGEKRSQVRLGVIPPEEGELRFVFHPDSQKSGDVVQRIHWDPEDGEILLTHGEETESLSENPFGVKFEKVQFFYFTHGNQSLEEEGSVSEAKLPVITGIEVALEARMGDQTKTLVNFISLRNAPVRTGYVTLQPDTVIPIPDSKKIHTLQLTNFSGVRDRDVLALEAKAQNGGSWKVELTFEKIGSSPAKIQSYKIEYPAGNPVVADFPRAASGEQDASFNLLALGSNGLYDYDDDPEIEDTVILEGEVTLEVTQMTLDGAGLFVRP